MEFDLAVYSAWLAEEMRRGGDAPYADLPHQLAQHIDADGLTLTRLLVAKLRFERTRSRVEHACLSFRPCFRGRSALRSKWANARMAVATPTWIVSFLA